MVGEKNNDNYHWKSAVKNWSIKITRIYLSISFKMIENFSAYQFKNIDLVNPNLFDLHFFFSNVLLIYLLEYKWARKKTWLEKLPYILTN